MALDGGFAEPYKYAFGTPIDASYDANLATALFYTILVDADCINPEHAAFFFKAQLPQRSLAIRGDVKYHNSV
jgi:hypothetical protein